jgi:hypothetical protein
MCRKGGLATKKKYGKKHFIKMANARWKPVISKKAKIKK